MCYLYKLKKHSEFQKVYKKGRFYKESNVSIAILQNHLSHNRIGIAVSTRCSKSSVRRNRAKRLLQAAHKQQAPQLKDGYDIIYSTKKDMANTKLEILAGILRILYKRSRLYK